MKELSSSHSGEGFTAHPAGEVVKIVNNPTDGISPMVRAYINMGVLANDPNTPPEQRQRYKNVRAEWINPDTTFFTQTDREELYAYGQTLLEKARKESEKNGNK